MRSSKLGMRILISMFIFLAGALSSWIFFTIVYRPTAGDILDAGAAVYFRKASEHGFSGKIDFRDCKLASPTESEKKDKIIAVVDCVSGEKELYFSAAIGASRSVVYYDIKGPWDE